MDAKKKTAKGKAPSKRQINLVVTEKKQGMGSAAKAGLVILALAVIAAGYYAYSQYSTLSNKKATLQQKAAELLSYKQQALNNAGVELDYIIYSKNYLSEEEKTYNDSLEMINKLRELVEPYGFITEMYVEGNEVEITVYSLDVKDVRESLQQERDKEGGMIKSVLIVTEVHPEQENTTRAVSSTEDEDEEGRDGTEETETKMASLSYASYIITFNDVEATGGSAK